MIILGLLLEEVKAAKNCHPFHSSKWINPNLHKPNNGSKIEIQIDGGQFAGKWEQEAIYIDGHFQDQGNILDKDVYGWRYK